MEILTSMKLPARYVGDVSLVLLAKANQNRLTMLFMDVYILSFENKDQTSFVVCTNGMKDK